MKKVLFLDHDGVICLSSNWGSRHKKWKKWELKHGSTSVNNMDVHHRFDNFDQKALKILNSIIEETDVEIVVSSDWKLHCTLDEMKDFYNKQGIIKAPIDFTPNIKSFLASDYNLTLEEIRILEIKKWIEDNTPTKWVAVDDLDMSELSNFVLCPRSYEGIKQSNIKEKIINLLNGSR